jgi:hypothetical protein
MAISTCLGPWKVFVITIAALNVSTVLKFFVVINFRGLRNFCRCHIFLHKNKLAAARNLYLLFRFWHQSVMQLCPGMWNLVCREIIIILTHNTRKNNVPYKLLTCQQGAILRLHQATFKVCKLRQQKLYLQMSQLSFMHWFMYSPLTCFCLYRYIYGNCDHPLQLDFVYS